MDSFPVIQDLSGDRDLLWIGGAALLLALIALMFLVSSVRSLFRGRLAASGGRLLVSTVLVVLTGVLLLIVSNLYVYEQLTYEQPVAEVRFEKVSERSFRMILQQDGDRHREFNLLGDEWQLDARVLKWKGPAQLAGLRNRYRLERVQGRYRDVRMEKSQRRSVYPLAEAREFDLWQWLAGQPDWMVWVDAYYGSSAYLPMADGASYSVVVTASGLLARPANGVAREAVAAW